MRNFFLLVRRYHLFLVFLLLQAVCLILLVRYNRSHQARYMEFAYETTGRINKQYTDVISYFSLGENNRRLAEENTRLRNLLQQNYTGIDTSARIVTDTVMVDSTQKLRKYLWRTAAVINNSTGSQNNYITLQRGRAQGIGIEMAVMGPMGIVGVVSDVSDNMAIVMSLLHRKNATSVMLKNSGINGILDWNGKSAMLLQLNGIPKTAAVKVGDTVLTSNISLNFPPGLMVGTIAAIQKNEEGNNHLLQVRPATNFYSVSHVDVIENLFLQEQRNIESRIKRQQ